MLSAALSFIFREAKQSIKISEDYRILDLTEQILGVKHVVVYCVVYSSVHYLGWCIAKLNALVYQPFNTAQL
jgi:hypothetical protein